MKTMALAGIRRMEVLQAPDPVLRKDTDVRIRMTTVGVCGSDIHYFTDGRIGSQVIEFPFVLGHEGAGIVERTGSSVTRVRVGDRVAIDPAMPCWKCDQCLSGRPNTCRSLRFLGCPGQAAGCLSEYLVMPETSCFPIPEGMTLEQATLSEPLAIGLYAVKTSIPMKGRKVGILGFGPIGLSVLLPARAQGAERIYVTDRIEARLEVAKKAGALWAGNPDREDIVEKITALEPAQLDVVFECCGEQDALDQAIRLLKPGGKLMIVGIPAVGRVSFDVDDMRRKEICIQNVRRQSECVEETLDAIHRGVLDVEPFVTHRFGLDDTGRAFDLVADYRDGVMKAIIAL